MPARQRAWFARLRALRSELNARGLRLDTLSMGMSADFEAAIAEGATIVRLGTALFGARPRSSRFGQIAHRTMPHEQARCILGAGNMGRALIGGLLRSRHARPSS